MSSQRESSGSALLQAYRAASRGEALDDWDAWVMELKLANPRQFALDLAKMEKEWARGASEAPADVEEDEGTERCVEMVRQLLGGSEEKAE